MRGLSISGALLVIVIILMAMTIRVRTEIVGESPPLAVHVQAERRLAQWALVPSPIGPLDGPLTVPVQGVARTSLASSWGDPRGGGARAHHGIDIAAPMGTLVIAAATGRVEKMAENPAGGSTVYVRSPAGKWSYYYAHLLAYAPGLHEGKMLLPGDPIGYVGDTGNAGAGNYHLHFGLSRMYPGDGWWQGVPVDPYPLLAGSGTGR
ncbi:MULTISPECIES: M23 family metallopeptidase [unclassified Sphingomonas]|uniref:M23 family metallopeptidase n=1 Tax=unclassified Sphingomonas TaxID=196159 RepID=UPI0026C2E469